jgi:Ser-tRNA(Ala) deacylase AlaX
MANSSEIVRLLEVERERYVLEIADIERRLSFMRDQIHTLDNLISGYSQEEHGYHSTGGLSESSSKQTTFFLNSSSPLERDLDKALQQIKSNMSRQQEEELEEEEEEEEEEVDISDIPKLSIARKPGSLPMLKQFREYSIQNAILILMRHQPHRHMHVDDVVRELYGDDLASDELKTAKATTNKMLSMGAQAGMWCRLLQVQGVYTLQYEKGVTSKPGKRR